MTLAAAAAGEGGGGCGRAGALPLSLRWRKAQPAPVLRPLYFLYFLFEKLLESTKVARGQRRVYDLRHFRAGAKVAQNWRTLCGWVTAVLFSS